MLARVNSCAVIGLDGVIVEVEVDTTQGLSGTDIVGLPDKAVQESRSRVQAAVKNAMLRYPRERIVVNLAPASVRKEGPTYDLPIAVGVLLMQALIPSSGLHDALVIGELSLEGTVRHSRGVLPMAATARQKGFKRIFVPAVDAVEAALIPDVEVYPVKSLRDLYLHLTDQQLIPVQPHVEAETTPIMPPTDFREIKGQEHVKRALEIAAAGGHNVITLWTTDHRSLFDRLGSEARATSGLVTASCQSSHDWHLVLLHRFQLQQLCFHLRGRIRAHSDNFKDQAEQPSGFLR